jgi:hypothetical protein
VISPKLFVHFTIVIQFLLCTVHLNCSTARQSLTLIHFLHVFFFFFLVYSICLQWQSQFLEPPTELTVASTPIISILTSRIRGALSRVFIDICSNWLVKLIWERVLQDFECIKGYLGSTKSQEVHYFSSMTCEMLLPRKTNCHPEINMNAFLVSLQPHLQWFLWLATFIWHSLVIIHANFIK